SRDRSADSNRVVNSGRESAAEATPIRPRLADGRARHDLRRKEPPQRAALRAVARRHKATAADDAGSCRVACAAEHRARRQSQSVSHSLACFALSWDCLRFSREPFTNGIAKAQSAKVTGGRKVGYDQADKHTILAKQGNFTDQRRGGINRFEFIGKKLLTVGQHDRVALARFDVEKAFAVD